MSKKTKVELAYDLGASVSELTTKVFGSPQKVPFSDLAKFAEDMKKFAQIVEQGAGEIESAMESLVQRPEYPSTSIESSSGIQIPID